MLNAKTRGRQPRPGMCHPSRWRITLSLLAGLSSSAALAYNEQGRLHDASSWHSAEFQRVWSLEAIGADFAYARGLSGTGILLGVADSGVDTRHPEFAAKKVRAVRLADAGCERERLATAIDNGCFHSDGDRASVIVNEVDEQYLSTLEALVAEGALSKQFLANYRASLGATYVDHGTHVAGTVLANRNGFGTHGVAYGAGLSTVRISSHSHAVPTVLTQDDPREVGPADPQAAAAVYARLRDQNVRVINHSWGLGGDLKTADELDNALQEQRSGLGALIGHGSVDTGILQVFAAGNTADGSSNPSPEAAPFADTLASLPRALPALEPYWLSVVNLDKNLTLSTGSARCGYSMNWCLAAPGSDINSTTISGEIDYDLLHNADGEVDGMKVTADRPVFGYASYSGTSMAAPHVTGALGLLMERFPYLDNPQIRDVLLTTARDLGAPGVDDVYGWGLVDLKKAIDGPGQLRVDTHVVMERRAGGTTVWQGGAWDDWRNDISGPGHLEKSANGWLRLSGNNSFGGATVNGGILELDGINHLSREVTVEGGLLRLNGTLQGSELHINGGMAHITGQQLGADTRVGKNGWLSGDGQLSNTYVQGTMMPGSEHRPMTINGDFHQHPEAILIARIGQAPGLPALHVTGDATLGGGTLRVIPQTGVYPLGQRLQILQTDGVLSGEFSALDHRQFSPFLAFEPLHDIHGAWVDVSRGLPLASAAHTPNQRAIAQAADKLDMSRPLAQRLTSLFPHEAPRALDQLSGELHASTQSVLLENSRLIRDAALSRARGELDNPALQADGSRQSVWLQALHQSGRRDADGNASQVNHNSTGVLIGADHMFEQGTRGGMLLASSRGQIKSAGAGKAEVDTQQVGLHIGHTWNAFSLYGGLAYARNPIKTKRRVNIKDLDEGLSSDYLSHTRQLFVEGNYALRHGAWDVQPYVQLARVRTVSEGFSEQGGHSALKGQGASNSINLATSGVRVQWDLSKTSFGPSWLSLTGGVGYTRASGDLRPSTDVAWQDASRQRITGAALDKQTLQLDLGAVARLSRDSALSLSLNDQRGERSQEQSVTAQYRFTF